MYEVRNGKRFVMHDPETGEYLALQDGATYNGKPAKPFRTDDVYQITQVWNMFGGSDGGFNMMEIKE